MKFFKNKTFLVILFVSIVLLLGMIFGQLTEGAKNPTVAKKPTVTDEPTQEERLKANIKKQTENKIAEDKAAADKAAADKKAKANQNSNIVDINAKEKEKKDIEDEKKERENAHAKGGETQPKTCPTDYTYVPERELCTSPTIRPNIPNGTLNGQPIYKCKDGYSDKIFAADNGQWCRKTTNPICPPFYESKASGQLICKQSHYRSPP